MDKNSKEMFGRGLTLLDIDVSSQEDFFNRIGQELYAHHLVKESFIQGIKQREAKYPTGLPSFPYPVAIPHCDPEHVLVNSISIVRFKKSIKFKEMGSMDKELSVLFAFVLTIDGIQQVPVLKELMTLFMDEKIMNRLLTANLNEVSELIGSL